MADFRLGRLKFNWKGDWAVSTAYVIDDIVKYGGNTYVCTTNHTSASSEVQFYSADLTKWSLHTEGIVNKGDWTSSYWYKINDVVKYGNTQFICTIGHTSGADILPANFNIYVEGLKYEDSWVASTNYQKGDIVSYGGYSYVAKGDHSSITTPNEDAGNWSVLSTGFIAKGEYASGTKYVPGDVVRFGGYSYACKATTTGNQPTDTTYWSLLAEGFNWRGAWSSSTVYQKGDVVNRNSNTYICITTDTTGASNAPELDPNGNYWNYIAQGGNAAQVLQDTGDLLYQAASGINRISLPAGSTGTAAQQREASGQVLTVGGNPLLPRWETNNATTSVYYVTETGDDSNNGKNLSRSFLTIRHAMAYISALTGADKPSATNPVTVYVKAGVYSEVLPIHIPAYVSIIGDNIRNTIVKPAAGNSNEQDLTLTTALTSFQLGETISSADGTKTGKLLDINAAKTVVTILSVSGGAWTTSDQYVDIISNSHADARNLMIDNKTFLANEAYHRHVANQGAVSGTEATVKSRLESAIEQIAYNLKHGGNNKVYDYAQALVGGTAITGNSTQDTQLFNYIDSVGLEIIQNISVTKSAGNNFSQTMFTGTADSTPKCAQVQSAHTTLVGIITTAISNGNMSGATSTNGYKTISAVADIINSESTMFFCATHNIVKDFVLEGMTGFVPDATNDKDMTAATVKGVYFRLDPAIPITKSPYIQNCSAFGGAAVGVIIDGGAHRHFDNSATPSYKSMVFDAFTQVLEGGVGFWCEGTSAAEIVSCFTYYAHISYTSTGGARIRAVSGNSSYGKYGCISRGFDVNEATKNGTVAGLMLTTDPQGAKSGVFSTGEIITGGTSNAIGELRSDQSASANKIYFIPRKGTFAQGELITGATSSATATLVNNTDAVRGQSGFILIAAGLTTGPDQGGSVELVDDGINNDSGSYVISNSSYTAPDGRGALTVTRAQLGSSAASHDGHSNIEFFEAAGNTAALQTNIAAGASSPFTMNVDAVTGMTINGFLVINNELFKIQSFPSATSVTAARAQEGTTAGTHNSGTTITILNAKVASQDKIIQDINSGATVIRVEKSNVGFGANDYIKIGSEFMKISSVATDTTGLTILQFADEKTIGCTDGQSFKIRYRYSQVRLTAHDFLDVGTGSKANTNWPYLPLSPNVPSQEIDETRPGRVYYVSTDQDGNFAVGQYFKVNQATGKATLDASAFDLSGLSSLRLGSIGAQLGAAINEFSTDGLLTQNSDVKVPTQKAVKTYVDNLSAVAGNFDIGGNLTVKGSTSTISSVDIETKDRNIILGKVASGTFTGDISSGSNQITNISDTTNIAPGVVVAISGGSGTVTLSGTVSVTGLTGTTATLDASFGGTGSATAASFTAGGATDATAAGGGITIKGATDKTIAWGASNGFDVSEHINLPSGKVFKINGVEVLSATQVLGTTIGSGGGIVTEDSASTLTNKTLSSATLTGTLTAGGGTGSSGQYLQSTASGVQWATLNVDATSIQNGNSNVTTAANSNVTVQTAGNLCATFDTSNNLTVVGTVTAQSAMALKDNIETIPDALARVLNLRGVEWDYKSNGTHNMGVVAEEIEQEFPCLVHTDNNGIKSVAYQNIVGVLIEAIKDLKSEIDQLKGK